MVRNQYARHSAERTERAGRRVTGQGTGSNIIVTRTAPATDGTHGTATTYMVRSSPSGAGTWTAVANVTSPYTLTGLAAGAAIDVQVQAGNAGGTGAWSSTSTLTTASAGPYAPNAPVISGVSAPPDGTTSKLAVTWGAPAVDGTHGAATGYNLRYSPSGAGTWTVVSGVTSPYTLTGLTGATAIDIEVQGTNAAASPGSWSAMMTGTPGRHGRAGQLVAASITGSQYQHRAQRWRATGGDRRSYNGDRRRVRMVRGEHDGPDVGTERGRH